MLVDCARSPHWEILKGKLLADADKALTAPQQSAAAQPTALREAWQPIETAPKGKVVTIYCPPTCVQNEFVGSAIYDAADDEEHDPEFRGEGWYRIGFSGSVNPTGWMPLPTPPTQQKENE